MQIKLIAKTENRKPEQQRVNPSNVRNRWMQTIKKDIFSGNVTIYIKDPKFAEKMLRKGVIQNNELYLGKIWSNTQTVLACKLNPLTEKQFAELVNSREMVVYAGDFKGF